MKDQQEKADRSDKYVALFIAAVLHVVLIIFFIRMSASDAPEAQRREGTASFTSRHRDMPIPPEGIATDSLPISGLRKGEEDQYEIALDCAYQMRTGSEEGVLRSGDPTADGVLGCPPTLPARDLPLAFSAHYDALGDLLGVATENSKPHTFGAVNALQLAKPRPGRQWQGGVLFRITIATDSTLE